MENDSWSLDPGTIVQESINFLPGPMFLASLDPGATAGPKLLALATRNPDQEKDHKDFLEALDKHRAEVKKRRLIESSISLVIWTGVDVFVIYRLGIFISTLGTPPT
nr:uncharacterized protein LOC129380699 [Dermacentor andersoni]